MKYVKPRLNTLKIQAASGGCTSGSKANGICQVGSTPSNKCTKGTGK